MKTLLTSLEDLVGKTIKSVEFSELYSSKINILTETDEVLIITAYGDWDRCGDFSGVQIDICTLSDLDYSEKEKFELLTEEDIERQRLKLEKIKEKREMEEREILRKQIFERNKKEQEELKQLAELKKKYEK